MTSQGARARALVDGLVAAGVRDLVVSPGSRSTPFVLAAVAHDGLRCHDVIDERAAGFFALGQARATGRPSALLCTSGTAAAHYYPAVIEASQAFVPLIVLSADRPHELHHCGANQTVEQTRLFGSHVRHFADVPVSDGSGTSLRALRRTAAQAVAFAGAPEPGPVHLNLRARKPLEPEAGEPAIDRGATTAVHGGRVVPDAAGLREVVGLLRSTARGVIVAGPAPTGATSWRRWAVTLARRTGWPLCAEGTSQLRFVRDDGEVPRCDAFDWIWREAEGREAWVPEAVLQLGATPVSAGFEALVGDGSVRRAVLAPHGWPDPTGTAEILLRADPEATLQALAAALDEEGTAIDGSWAAKLGELDRRVWALVEADLDAGDGVLSEAHAAREVVNACDGRAWLAVGNSLPVRHLDAWARGGRAEVPVASQRGASGIDGLVAGAAGVAHGSGRPTVLLVGDVSFLHDLGGLDAARHVDTPLAVVVLCNGGGRIFEQLPIGARPELESHLPHFTTPHRASIAHAAGVYGHRHVRVERTDALREALAGALETGGVTVIETAVPPHDATERRARVAARVRETLHRGTVS